MQEPRDDNKKSVGLNLYDNTDIKMSQVKKFVEEVKQNGTVKRIHLIGGEPLVHRDINKIFKRT